MTKSPATVQRIKNARAIAASACGLASCISRTKSSSSQPWHRTSGVRNRWVRHNARQMRKGGRHGSPGVRRDLGAHRESHWRHSCREWPNSGVWRHGQRATTKRRVPRFRVRARGWSGRDLGRPIVTQSRLGQAPPCQSCIGAAKPAFVCGVPRPSADRSFLGRSCRMYEKLSARRSAAPASAVAGIGEFLRRGVDRIGTDAACQAFGTAARACVFRLINRQSPWHLIPPKTHRFPGRRAKTQRAGLDQIKGCIRQRFSGRSAALGNSPPRTNAVPCPGNISRNSLDTRRVHVQCAGVQQMRALRSVKKPR